MEEEKENKIDKIYFGINEVSEMTGVPSTTIRFWEGEFEVMRIKKGSRGDRYFTKKDIEQIILINHLVKEKGYTIEGARKKLIVNPQGEADKLKLIQTLEKVKEVLQQLRKNLDDHQP